MTFLPIVARELRVAARRRATYWVRIGAAVAVIVLGTWCFLMMQHQPPQDLSIALFGIMTGGAVLYALLSGLRSTSDCLSEEKREGTLGLLFLTDLKGYDVVFGKLVATSLNTFYGVIAVVPILAIPLLMGGVTPGEFGRMALVALNTMFLSLTIGIAISSMSRSGRKSAIMTLLLILFFAAAMPLLGASLDYFYQARWLEPFFFFPSSGFTFAMAFDGNFKLYNDRFWESLALVHGLGWLFLVLACLVAPRSWQDKPAGIRKLRWRERWQAWSYGTSEERRRFRSRLLDQNAFYWLAARVRLKPAHVWASLGFLGCGWIWGLLKWGRDWLNGGTYLLTGIILNLLIKIWFSSEVGRQLAEDRKAGALELLLATPLTVRDILHGQLLALRRQFLGPVLVVLAVFFILTLATLSDNASQGDTSRSLCLSLGGGAMLMLLGDLAALYWLGSWLALTARSPSRAANGNLLRILILPAGVWGVVSLVVSLTMVLREYDLTWQFPLALWFGLGVVTDIAFGRWARHKLLTEFRAAAEQRFSTSPGLWQRLFGTAQTARAPLPPVVQLQR